MVDALIHASPSTSIGVCQEVAGQCTVILTGNWQTDSAGTVLITQLPYLGIPIWYRFYVAAQGPNGPHVTIGWGFMDFAQKEGTIPTGGTSMTWDVRTTDLWVHQLDAQNNIVKSWNILQGEVPQIPAGTQLRVDIRLRNFGSATVPVVGTVLQSVARDGSWSGSVIYASCPPTQSCDLAVGAELVYVHWHQMYTKPIYDRLWVRKATPPTGDCNCGSNVPPPYDLCPNTNNPCNQGELYDFALSSRHLVAIDLPAVVLPVITVSPTQVQRGGTLTVSGSKFTSGGAVRLFLIDSTNVTIGSAYDIVGPSFTRSFTIPQTAAAGQGRAQAEDSVSGQIVSAPFSIQVATAWTVTVHVTNAQTGQPVPGANVNLT